MMHAHYINPLIQFGYIAFDLCFEQEGTTLRVGRIYVF